jgi:hypothetical protein
MTCIPLGIFKGRRVTEIVTEPRSLRGLGQIRCPGARCPGARCRMSGDMFITSWLPAAIMPPPPSLTIDGRDVEFTDSTLSPPGQLLGPWEAHVHLTVHHPPQHLLWRSPPLMVRTTLMRSRGIPPPVPLKSLRGTPIIKILMTVICMMTSCCHQIW